jgi:hypothetical protein
MQPDRFAREIVGILAHSGAARSQRLMRHPFGGCNAQLTSPYVTCLPSPVSITCFD